MASRKKLKSVLRIIATAPDKHIKILGDSALKHTAALRRILKSDNVVGIGINEKNSGKTGTGELVITFYVKKKIPLSRLKGNELIPNTIPSVLSGKMAITTDVVVLGTPKIDVNRRRRPIEPGNSIGHVRGGEIGTLGAIVTDGRLIYLLSNSHVLAENGLARLRDSILYPCSTDGGTQPLDVVAELARFIPFRTGDDFPNLVDCAMAIPLAQIVNQVVFPIRDLFVPSGIITAQRGMHVVKVGRTTGKTEGDIVDTDFHLAMGYRGVGTIGFRNQVLCTRFTKPGDSGSLVVDTTSGKAVGLHFASSPAGSIFNPIREVLSALQVNLVTSSQLRGITNSPVSMGTAIVNWSGLERRQASAVTASLGMV